MSHRILCMSLLVLVSSATVARANDSITNIDIPAQPLATALRQFADQAGLQLAVETSLTSGKTSRAIKGEVSTQDALERLLGDSGLLFEVLDGRMVAVSPSAKAMNLEKTAYTTSDIRLAQAEPQSSRIGGNEPTAARATGTLEEVVVTAEFRQENVQTTPLAITALNANVMRERGDVALPDLASAAPNVTFNSGTGIYAGAQLFIRGVGQTDPNPALEPGVGVYIDDVYYGAVFGGDMDLLDLDRVEILRGPQGTLAGANSIGGAVKLFTAKPTGNGAGYAEAGYGSNQAALARGAFDTSLIEDKLFLRVSAGSRRDNGYVRRIDFACANPAQAGALPRQAIESTNCEVGRAGGKDSIALRGALRWLASDRLEVNLAVEAGMQNSQPVAETLIAVNPTPIGAYNTQQQTLWGVQFDRRFIAPKDSYITYADYTDRGPRNMVFPSNGNNRTYGYFGTVDYKLTDQISLKSITGYRTVSGYAPGDFDASPLNVSTAGRILKYRQFTEELRLNGSSFKGFLDWTVGGFLYDAHGYLGGTVDVQGAAVAFGGLFTQYDDNVESNKNALFATATAHLSDKLSLTGGYRYSHSEKVYINHHTDPQNGFVISVLGAGQLGRMPTATSDRSDYRAAIQYEWTPELMTYAQVATGYKDGGLNPFAVAVREEVPFGAESMTAYEAGLKSELFDRHLRFNLAGFMSKYKDLQLRGQIPSPTDPSILISVITNAGRVTIKGIEAELELRPVSKMLISASGSYMDFSYDSLGVAGLIANGPCLACTNIYTPKYKANFAAQYDFDLGNGGSLTPRISADYQASMFGDLANNPAMLIPARWVTNARLTWKAPGNNWEAALAVNNLLDEYYYTHVTQQYYSVGTATANLGRPREVMFTVRRNFQ